MQRDNETYTLQVTGKQSFHKHTADLRREVIEELFRASLLDDTKRHHTR